ncbi:MAG TPA: 2OG-Fe(II) oxygenase [Candidatus Binatia bacterium]|nr:2OG-Fe(II) oxygenase [Candidatus Binatia bacterium]
MPPASIGLRLARLDWPALARGLDAQGYATVPALLTAEECAALARSFTDDRRFRATVDMARHRFGVGRYRYFAEPLPPLVAALRAHAYRGLAPIANRWMEALGLPGRFPPTLGAFRSACAARGQRRPTPLLLRYEAGGYNCLHQDLYGAVFFPLQLTCLLSRPGTDFRGGELLLVEQRPRAQSRGVVVALAHGDAAIFPTRWRPVAGTRGLLRAAVRHGVSPLTAGARTALGIIFHDAA